MQFNPSSHSTVTEWWSKRRRREKTKNEKKKKVGSKTIDDRKPKLQTQSKRGPFYWLPIIHTFSPSMIHWLVLAHMQQWTIASQEDKPFFGQFDGFWRKKNTPFKNFSITIVMFDASVTYFWPVSTGWKRQKKIAKLVFFLSQERAENCKKLRLQLKWKGEILSYPRKNNGNGRTTTNNWANVNCWNNNNNNINKSGEK